jgi:hypothetical protein
MDADLRAGIAYITARLVSGVRSTQVYDYSKPGYINMSGTVEANQVSVYDYGRNCHITGTGSRLYDHGEKCHVTLAINGNQFTGYDHGTSANFKGTVNGSSVALYDYSESQYFQYSI